MIPTSGVVPMSKNLWTYMVSRYHDLFRVFLGPVPREFLFAPPGASANPKKRDIQEKRCSTKFKLCDCGNFAEQRVQTNKRKLTGNAWMKARWEPRERFHHPNLWLLWWVQAAIQHQTLEDVLWCQSLKWWIRLQVNFCNKGNATCRGRLR